MSGVSVAVDDKEVNGALRRLSARLDNMKPVFDEIGLSLVTSTQDRFEDSRGPEGEAWKPSYRATQDGGLTLVQRGHLKSSITHRANRTRLEIGSNLIYAAIHQFGGVIRAKTASGLTFPLPSRRGANKQEFRTVQSVTMPARPFLGLSVADKREINAIVDDHFARVTQ